MIKRVQGFPSKYLRTVFPARVLLIFCAALLPLFIGAQNNTVTVVDGTFKLLSGFAGSGTNNLLIVTNGGNVSLTSIASQNTARSNAVIVTGLGSLISGSGLRVGPSGISNTLQFVQGGSLSGSLRVGGTDNFLLCANTTFTNVPLFVDGLNNVIAWTNAVVDGSSIRFNSADASMTVERSIWTSSDMTMQGARNQITLTGDSSYSSDTFLLAGLSSRFNVEGGTFQITDSARLSSTSAVSPGSLMAFSKGAVATFNSLEVGFSSNNELQAEGDGTTVTVVGPFTLGSSGTSNQVTFSNGATFLSENATVGARSGGNRVALSGPDTAWVNNSTLTVAGPTANRIEILDGAALVTSSLVTTSRFQRLFLGKNATLSTEVVNLQQGDFAVDLVGPHAKWLQTGPLATTLGGADDAFRVSGGSIVTSLQTVIGQSSRFGFGGRLRSFSSLVVSDEESRWITGDFQVGFNASSNAVLVSNHGAISASAVTVGSYTWSSFNSSNEGSQNSLTIDGLGSSLLVASDIVVGNLASDNRLAVSNGALVSARQLWVGHTDSFGSPFPRSNVVEVLGPGSQLTLLSNMGFASYQHLRIADGAKVLADTGFLGCALTIQGVGSQLRCLRHAVGSAEKALLADGGQLTAPKIDLGLSVVESDILITGLGSLLEGGIISLNDGDAFGFASTKLSIVVADNGRIAAQDLRIGPNSPTSTNLLTLDGGNVTADTLLLDNGSIDVRHGLLRAGAMEVVGTNATIATASGFFVGASETPFDGQFHAAQLALATTARMRANTAVTFAGGSVLAIRASEPTASALLAATGVVSVHGLLKVTLLPGHSLQPGTSIALLTAPTVTGNFDNISSGQRLTATDGGGSFVFSITGNAITLNDFQVIDPPDVRASFDAANSKIILSFLTGSASKIQTSSDLLNWAEIPAPEFETSGDQTQWTTSIEIDQPRRFYRLVR